MRVRYTVRITPEDVGRRVSIRARIREGGKPTAAPPPGTGAASATDTVGVLRSWQDGVLELERRDGTAVRLPEEDLLSARVVPPTPQRNRRPGPPID